MAAGSGRKQSLLGGSEQEQEVDRRGFFKARGPRTGGEAYHRAPGSDRGIFVTNFPTAGFLSHASLRKRRPDLITVRVTGWSDGDSAVDYTINAALGVSL